MIEIYTDKELININNNILKNLFLKTRTKILTEKRQMKNTRELEIYYCYIVRELERRN